MIRRRTFRVSLFQILPLFVLVFIACRVRSYGAENDLVITSLAHNGNCTTLTWNSHTGEFYTVYSTTNLCLPIFWRVEEVNVPSGGASTTWSESDCGEMQMMSSSSQGSSGFSSLSEQD